MRDPDRIDLWIVRQLPDGTYAINREIIRLGLDKEVLPETFRNDTLLSVHRRLKARGLIALAQNGVETDEKGKIVEVWL